MTLPTDLSFSVADRVVSGLLLPYNENIRIEHESTTDNGLFSVERGTITLPADVPNVVGLNEAHDRFSPIGRGITLTDTPMGIYASFSVAATPEGDAALADVQKKVRNALSAEVKGLVVEAGKTVAGAITGAALAVRGAFPSAVLFAVDDEPPADSEDPPADDEPKETTEKFSEEFTDEDGNTQTRTTTRTTKVEGDKTTITETTVIEQPEAPAEEENPVTNTAVPATFMAGASSKNKNEKMDKNALFAMIANAVRTDDTSALFALNDVKISGANAVGTGVVQPEILGEIWSGRRYERRVIPLTGSGTLSKLNSKGWRWKQAPEVDEWAGNKAAVPSNTPETEEANWTTTRFAGGWDIAREFYDFGETEVIESFLRLAADSYAKKSDNKHLANLLAGATSAPVGAVPDGVAPGLAKIVRGALRVITSDAQPSYAIVAPGVYEEILFTKKDDILAYLSMSLGLEDGQVESFKIVPHVGMAAGSVLVGDKQAASAYELPGSPIRVSAIDIAKGGLDEALFGYIQTRIEYPTGLQLVTNNAGA